jgi:hypothetical protein
MATIDVHYNMDHSGMGVMLNAEFLRGPITRHAERIKQHAEFLAASEIYVGGIIDEIHHGQTGAYLGGFRVTSRRSGGIRRDRVEATVTNNAPSAFWVEFGHWGREPYRIMARAAFAAKGGRHP